MAEKKKNAFRLFIALGLASSLLLGACSVRTAQAEQTADAEALRLKP